MPKINLCFLWHMHQPFYKDLASGEYRLPWTRLHALKDYYGMVKILDDFPIIHQTFNLVPSLLLQIEEYASGNAFDPFLTLALKPAEQLTPAETEFILKYFFQANEDRVIRRYPRYAELLHVFQCNDRNPRRAAAHFDTQMIRDLQVLSQVAWFDEYDLEQDPDVNRLVAKSRNYDYADQVLVGEKERRALARVLDTYRNTADRGQIELSTSAYYHPILPLICDSSVARVSHPYVPLPTRFSYPADAEEQLRKARLYFESKFGVSPAGLWPSEGSVSDATLDIAAKTGFRWVASDDGVLARTLNVPATSENTYQAYTWKRNHREIDVVFRDHRMSDLIGFVYSRMEPYLAAVHFLDELRQRCAPVLESGRDALVPIILDGENAWESYVRNGRPFLLELYGQLARDPNINALTISEVLSGASRKEIDHIFPGSWIDSTLDIWIGSEEDNVAWERLLEAHKVFDRVVASGSSVSEQAKRAAYEELLIAEGSDWCWWYGPQHASANKPEFDQLYRGHLANMYRLLGEEPPANLAEPITKLSEESLHQRPSGLIQPIIDGIVSRAEWTDAGRYRVDPRSGAMHSRRPMVQDLYYGSDGKSIYLRLDLVEPPAAGVPYECRLEIRNSAGTHFEIRVFAVCGGENKIFSELPENSVDAALAEVFEIRLSMSALHVRLGEPLFLHLSVFRDGLPLAAIPGIGELEIQYGIMATYAF